MDDYKATDDQTTTQADRRRGPGATIGMILLAIAVIVGLLFATGFWKADVSGGALPEVDVSAKSGAMPDVDLDSKEVVIGTKETTVEVPTVGTKETQIDVPVVGVKEGDKD